MARRPRETIAAAAARGRAVAAGMRAGREASELIGKSAADAVKRIFDEHGETAACKAAEKIVEAALSEFQKRFGVLEISRRHRKAA